jgi:hypothetical protein
VQGKENVSQPLLEGILHPIPLSITHLAEYRNQLEKHYQRVLWQELAYLHQQSSRLQRRRIKDFEFRAVGGQTGNSLILRLEIVHLQVRSGRLGSGEVRQNAADLFKVNLPLPCACGISSASAYGYVCTQDLEVRWHIGVFALLSGNDYLEVFCHSDQLHFALLVLVYPDSALFHCGSVAWANPNDIVSRGRSQPRRIGKMPHSNIQLRVAAVFISLDFYNPGRCRNAAAGPHGVFLRSRPRPYGKQRNHYE